ncbi:MAG: flagellar biosynthesis repressor FlbT [Aestuariivirgaceae bacterium]
MKQSFRLSLRAGEKIYINGAVLRVDRKVTLELLNDVTFLLESHVLQPDEATTPLRQLYFVVQTMLIEPNGQDGKLELFRDFYGALQGNIDNPEMLASLVEIDQLVADGRCYEALKTIRTLYVLEEEILQSAKFSPPAITDAQRSQKDGSYAA